MKTNLFTYEMGMITPGIEIIVDSTLNIEFARAGRQNNPPHLMNIKLRDPLHSFRIQERTFLGKMRRFVMCGNFYASKNIPALILISDPLPNKIIFVMVKYRNCSLIKNAQYAREDFNRLPSEHKSEMYFLIQMEPGAEIECWNTQYRKKQTLRYEDFQRNQ
jgi:hypothetical protein